MGLTEEKVIDLDLGQIKKTKIRVSGDQTRILELNLSDMGILDRLNSTYKNLLNLADEVSELSKTIEVPEGETPTDEQLENLAKSLKDLDAKMREEVDYLFDSKVSDVCVPNGTMYDPHDGEFTFEYVIGKLAELYTNNFKHEFDAMRKNVSKHTDKYTKIPQDRKRKQTK